MNDLDSAKTTPAKTKHFRSLQRKIFIPFFLFIMLLSSAGIYGAFHLAERSFENSTDERLRATQEVLYREFKKQETILQTYAVLLQHLQALSRRFQGSADIGVLQDKLYATLDEASISTAFFPADIRNLVQQESLISMFDQVRRSERARFRYSNEFGSPVLMVAAPIMERGEITQILLLQSEMGDAFLRNITSSLKVDASLMTIDGVPLAQSRRDSPNIVLTPAQLTSIGNGESFHFNVSGAQGPERHLFSMVPLGNSDMVLLSVQAAMQQTTTAQYEMILQLVAVMLALIVIGTISYSRRITSIIRPVKELRNAADAVSRGNLNYRILELSNDELGLITTSFNQMAQALENSYQERASHDIAEALSREELKTRAVIERKERDKLRATEELGILQREISALYQLNQAMTTAVDLTVLFDRILQVMSDIIACDHVVLLAYNAGDSSLEVVRVTGLDADALKDVRFNFNQGITGEAAQTQRLIYIKNIDEDARNLSYHGQFVTRGSMISAPLVVKGRLVGILNLHKKQVDAFSSSEQKLVQAIANQTAIAIDNAQLIEKSRDMSNIDELTGLANRRHFQDILKREVAQARRFSSVFSIIMCDVDGFKTHISTLGRMQSDALLRLTGQFLLKNTRGIDLVCRFGNDQFIILLPKTSKQGAVAAAEKLRSATQKEDFSKEISMESPFNITLSFGVTEFPGDSKNIYELLNLADRSLYAAKREGGNCTVGWEGPAPGPE